MKVNIQSLTGQTITEQLDGEIEIKEKHLIYKLEFYCDEENDDTAVWEKDVYRKYESMFLKSHIAGIGKSRSNKEDKWAMTIFLSGSSAIVHYFETEDKCNYIFDKIQKWLLE